MITQFTRMLTGAHAMVALSMAEAIHNYIENDDGEHFAELEGIRYEKDLDDPTGMDDIIYLDFVIEADYDNAERNSFAYDFALFEGAEFEGWRICFSDSCSNCKQYHLALQRTSTF